jgi:hypothetical protein
MTATTFDPAEHPHRRFNALAGRWVRASAGAGLLAE